MAQFEDNTHVFIVRVWLEPREVEGANTEWRGHIIYVPSGERRYLKHPDDIVDFVAPYLEKMGVKMGIRWRVGRWLKHKKAQLWAHK